MSESFVPAAQYLRMSTDHQQYSLDNQADAIARYAAGQGFQIVKTYCDAARSGLHLKNRPDLKQLLTDVVAGDLEFRAILVYDVSRWGRFQDIDEAAHYEYLCKSAGVPIFYCAEPFANQNSTAELILKAMKRAMAGEYSRELSAKVKAGQLRLVRLGYKMGGFPPYGMRRMLLDTHGTPKQLLADFERKSLTTERVILVPGPADEIAVVQRIFREYAHEQLSLTNIARNLNNEGISFVQGGKWTTTTVAHALDRTQYMGTHVWGRTTAYLSSRPKKVSAEQWGICPSAFQPIISRDLFERAQKRLTNITYRVPNEKLLERLRPILKEHGKLTSRIIQRSRLCPGVDTYVRRFGGLLSLYSRLGYDASELINQATSRQRGMLVRHGFIQAFVNGFPSQFEEVRATRRFRAMLRYRRTGLLISVMVARHHPTGTGKARWFIQPPRNERRRVTILGLMNEDNASVTTIRVFRTLDYPNRTNLKFAQSDQWWEKGERLETISELLHVLARVGAITVANF
jgi:DNA invertase Pin-like site-specific DNA recombinase